MARKRKKYITDRDLDILQIMWRHSGSMTASEICRQDDTLTMNTAQAVLRKLLREGFIEVADIVYSGTVLTRSYKPAIMAADYISEYFLSGNTLQTFSAFIKKEKDQKVLAELNDIIEQRMKDLSEDDSLWRK